MPRRAHPWRRRRPGRPLGGACRGSSRGVVRLRRVNGSTAPEFFSPRWAMMVGMRDVTIDSDMIRLGQFLKLADLIDTGGEGKILIAAGDVTVNGEVDTRRGRQLRPGDVVTVQGRSARVTST